MNKICFIGFFPDYETYFFKAVQLEDMTTEVFNPLEQTNRVKFFKKLPRFIRNIWHRYAIVKYIKEQPNAHFIFNEHRLLLQGVCQYLHKNNLPNSKNKAFKGYLLLRNPVEDNSKIKPHLSVLQQHGVNILTFDKGDSKKYGYKRYPQFASIIPSVQHTQTAYDFSFIGRDKGRAKQLEHLQNQLQKAGYQPHFDIRKPTDGNLSYLQYLQQSLQAKCMVEILQIGQTGMTLRAIEALLYGRKLLTTNTAIIDEPFYHKNNIMIFDGVDVNMDELTTFMQAPLHHINKQIKNQYSTDAVVAQALV